MSEEPMQDALARLYKPPHQFTVAKAIDHVDAHGRKFIGLSPFVVIGTGGARGLDVSPRGGGPGFVKVDEAGKTLFMPDRPGNNRIDSLKNIAETGEIGLLFLIPGMDDVYRVNGRAELAYDDSLLQAFVEFGKPPRSVLRIAVREAFLHCPKALMRADLWGDSHRIERSAFPSLAEMVSDQIGLPKPQATHEEQVAQLKETL
ncbi:MSMEG_1061 family FMN-dependent PPOX-type flavoprotein [Phenylobacterium sp.]|jgi:PPOX class probable FMN-dependent enzyme|uniref:MSMEG_1061 family FMN-dependent PPOX-type flavoprotein n=1 Tax=Phenylobacterium sp. TaxID=1871053 RepID=UPI002F956A62